MGWITLRRGLLVLAGILTLGTAAELTADRHWSSPIQVVPWFSLVALALAIGLVARARSSWSVHAAQALAVFVLLTAVLGIWEHVHANYEAGPLDFRFTDVWDGLSEATRWWLALTATVGPSPPFAPGVLAHGGLTVLLATVRHPALGFENGLEPGSA